MGSPLGLSSENGLGLEDFPEEHPWLDQPSQGSSETSSLVRGLGVDTPMGKGRAETEMESPAGGMQCVHSPVTGLCGLAHGWQANDSSGDGVWERKAWQWVWDILDSWLLGSL